MPAIYTAQWYDALKQLINSSRQVEKNAPRGKFKVLADIRGDARSAYLGPAQRALFVIRFEEGKCVDYVEVAQAPPRKEFDFIFELSATVFEGIAAGLTDLVDAGLKGAIRVTGDMRILIRHAELVNALYDVYAREVPTDWPKGKPSQAPAAARA